MVLKKIGTKEAAELMHMTRARVSQLCKQGFLDAEFVSNVWLIDYDSVVIYAQERRKRKSKSMAKKPALKRKTEGVTLD